MLGKAKKIVKADFRVSHTPLPNAFSSIYQHHANNIPRIFDPLSQSLSYILARYR